MAENPKEFRMNEDNPKTPINWFSLFPKFELRFPLPWLESKPEIIVNDGIKTVDTVIDEGKEEKPNTVKFPKTDLVVTSLETEADVSGKTSNPAILWQVYALGGFLILSWAWARWKERRSRKRSDDDDDDDDDDDEEEEKHSGDT